MSEKKQTVPVRLPVWLISDAGIAAPAADMTVPEYITAAVVEALLRDLPKVGSNAAQRVERLKGKRSK